MTVRNILVIDDDETHSKVLSKVIGSMGHNCLFFDTGFDVINLFVNKQAINGVNYDQIDVLLLDISLPDIDGISVIRKIAEFKGDAQIIVLTGDDNTNLAINAMNLGAIDYIVKGEKDLFTRVTASVNNAIEKKNLRYQLNHLFRKGQNQNSFSDIIGQSKKILEMISIAKKIVNSKILVLISGPSGSGKEFLARVIHGSGEKTGKPFVSIDCGLLNGSDGEKQLFGSDRLLSDSGLRRIGKIHEANNGTILFKNVELLNLDMQTKVLRFLQDGGFFPVGSKNHVTSDARIIFSTKVDLLKMVRERKFRQDFYYKIFNFTIDVPSLKERGEEDIKLLSESFCFEFSSSENKKIKKISNDALAMLYKYNWDDNIRQLKNLIFRAVVMSEDNMLNIDDFPKIKIDKPKEVEKKEVEQISNRKKYVGNIVNESINIFDVNGKCKSLEEIEIELINRLTDLCEGNLTEVAKNLQIGRSTIYRRVKKNDE
jgi:DNA-binding NtrC family response regulator